MRYICFGFLGLVVIEFCPGVSDVFVTVTVTLLLDINLEVYLVGMSQMLLSLIQTLGFLMGSFFLVFLRYVTLLLVWFFYIMEGHSCLFFKKKKNESYLSFYIVRYCNGYEFGGTS